MSDRDLIARACQSVRGYLRLGNETTDGPLATFVRNRECARRYDANHADAIAAETPTQIDALFAAAEGAYEFTQHRRYDVDPLTPPPFAARLALEGYKPNATLQGILEGPLNATPRDVDIREIADDAAWGEYGRLQTLDFIEGARKEGREPDLALLPEWQSYVRAKQPDVRFWLAYVDGAARAYCNAWPGTNGVGMVEDLFTEEPYRHRGLATALIAHCVADARARGGRDVLIGADPNDTPKNIYAAMGFRPLMMTTSYVKGGRHSP